MVVPVLRTRKHFLAGDNHFRLGKRAMSKHARRDKTLPLRGVSDNFEASLSRFRIESVVHRV